MYKKNIYSGAHPRVSALIPSFQKKHSKKKYQNQKTRVRKDLLSFFVFFRESREKKKKNQDFQDFCLFFSGSLEIFEIFEKS